MFVTRGGAPTPPLLGQDGAPTPSAAVRETQSVSLIEPAVSPWEFPDPLEASDDVVAIGADLEPGTILAAYRRGLFPMHLDPGDGARQLGWWSPDPRGVLLVDELKVSRSLGKAVRDFEITVDADFEAVIDGCADPDRPGRWIVRSIREAYLSLHGLGWAHSVEAWSADGRLAGGLYGIAIGGFFAGESMFHRQRDASKVALVGLVERLRASTRQLIDVQWATPHLTTLGVKAISRPDYLARLAVALQAPLPAVFAVQPPSTTGAAARNNEKRA